MKIVKAKMEDIPSIFNLQRLAYQSEAELLNDYNIPPLRQTENEIREEFEKGVFLVAIDDKQCIIGSVRAYKENNTAYIGKLMVSPEYQGHGIGTKLLIAIEEHCPAKEYELFTSSKSEKNLKLYQKLGYEKFDEKPLSDNIQLVYLKKQFNERKKM